MIIDFKPIATCSSKGANQS